MMAADDAAFPASLREKWESESCLSWGDGEFTWLCRRRKDGLQAVIKIADNPESIGRLENEYEILTLISRTDHPAARLFPLPLSLEKLTEPAPRLAFARTWLPGRTLEALTESPSGYPGLPREKAIRYLLEVLEQLEFLHGLQPPVIHRDIKPQNVIVDGEDHCHLIDLDIAWQQNDRDKDTLAVGTRLTSPPEQFGFRATDARSDIYSAGVLLRYCLTGAYGEAEDAALPEDLKAIVQKATRFDPENRYQRAADFRADLLALSPAPSFGRRHGWARRAGLTGLCALLLAAAFLLGRWSAAPGTPFLSAPGPAFEITEALFDGDGELFGAYQRGDPADYTAVLLPDGLHITHYLPFLHRLDDMSLGERMPLSEVELRALLDSLQCSPLWETGMVLSIVGRDIESLEPFRRSYASRHISLEFRNCSLPEDPSPLAAAVPYLDDLACYNGTSVSWRSLDFLNRENEMCILYLVFDGSAGADLSALGRLKSLKTLCLANTPVDPTALEAISQMKNLEVLYLPNCGVTDATPLERPENLTELKLNEI